MTLFGGVVFGFVWEGSTASTRNKEWDGNYALLLEVGHPDQTKEGRSFLRNEKSTAKQLFSSFLAGSLATMGCSLSSSSFPSSFGSLHIRQHVNHLTLPFAPFLLHPRCLRKQIGSLAWQIECRIRILFRCDNRAIQ